MEQGRIRSQDEDHGDSSPGALACSLPSAEYAQRLEAVLQEFSQGLEEMEELPDGYALRFPGSERWIENLVDFVVGERHCCPFFVHELVFEPAGGPVWLRLRGIEVKEHFGSVELKGGVLGEGRE